MLTNDHKYRKKLAPSHEVGVVNSSLRPLVSIHMDVSPDFLLILSGHYKKFHNLYVMAQIRWAASWFGVIFTTEILTLNAGNDGATAGLPQALGERSVGLTGHRKRCRVVWRLKRMKSDLFVICRIRGYGNVCSVAGPKGHDVAGSFIDCRLEWPHLKFGDPRSDGIVRRFRRHCHCCHHHHHPHHCHHYHNYHHDFHHQYQPLYTPLCNHFCNLVLFIH